jgi:hypothetical protein
VLLGLALLAAVGFNRLPPSLSDSSYLFCLFVLLTNGLYLALLQVFARLCGISQALKPTPSTIERPSPLDLSRLHRYRTEVHFTLLHIALALLSRAFREAPLFTSTAFPDYDLRLQARLTEVNQEAVFFVWAGVLVSRGIQLLIESLALGFGKTSWLHRDRSTEFWFASYVLFSFALLFGVMNPAVSLLAVAGLMLEFGVQWLRIHILNAPPIDATSFIPWQIPSDLVLLPLSSILISVVVSPIKVWILGSAAAALGVYVLAYFISSGNIQSKKARAERIGRRVRDLGTDHSSIVTTDYNAYHSPHRLDRKVNVFQNAFDDEQPA